MAGLTLNQKKNKAVHLEGNHSFSRHTHIRLTFSGNGKKGEVHVQHVIRNAHLSYEELRNTIDELIGDSDASDIWISTDSDVSYGDTFSQLIIEFNRPATDEEYTQAEDVLKKELELRQEREQKEAERAVNLLRRYAPEKLKE